MKGRSRIFALFLTLVIFATSFAWPSVDVMVTSADEGTTTDAVPYTKQKFSFDNMDITELEKAGFTSTRLKSNSSYAVDGTADTKVSEHWFTGKTGTGITGNTLSTGTEGLKSNANKSDSRYTLLNSPYTYSEFYAKVEVNWGTNAGILFGKQNVYPTNKNSDAAVRVQFANNRIQLCGALDYSTATVSGRTNGWTTWESTGIYYFHESGNFSATKDKAYTMNVRVEDGVLSVWVDGYATKLTVKLAEHYQSGRVALIHNKCDDYGGGFKSFEIADLNATGYADFDNVDVAQLDSAGYTSTRFNKSTSYAVDGTADSKVSDQWFSGKGKGTLYEGVTGISAANIGLKPNQNSDTYFTSLNTPYHYDNFHLTTEVYWGSNTGIIIGKKNTWATETDDTSFRIYFNANQIQIVGGGLDYSTQTVTGGTGSWNAGYAPTYIFKPAKNYTSQKNVIYQLHVKLQDGVLSVWLEGYESVLTVAVSDTFKNENIALSARKYGGDDGGFKSFSIVELAGASEGTTVDENGYTDFDSVSVSALKKKGFTSTRYNASDSYKIIGEKETEVSSHWFSGKKYQNKVSSNLGLKPNQKESDKTMTILNTPYTSENGYEEFQMITEVYWGSNVGVVLGKKNVFPSAEDSSAIRIYFNANQLQISGGGMAVDTARVTGGTATWNSGYAPTYIFNPGSDFKGTKGEVYRLHVNYKNGTFSAWVDGWEGVLTFKTVKGFKQESIGLCARNYDGDNCGFKSLKMTDAIEPAALDGFESLGAVEEMFDAYYLKDATESAVMERVNLREHWKLDNGILARTTVCDTTVDWKYAEVKDVDVLTYKARKYTDFELTYTYQQTGRRLGIVIGGEAGEYPISYENGKATAKNGAIIYLENEGYSNAKGNLNNLTNKDSLLYRVSKFKPDGFEKTGTLHTVKVVVKDKALAVFIDGSSFPALYTYLGDSYKGGYISLFAHANNQHGFKDFVISDKVTTVIPEGAGTSVSGNTFTADFNTTKLDLSQFETYYLAKAKGNATGAMEKADFQDMWTLDNGVLESNTLLESPTSKTLEEFEYDDSTKAAVLTYKKKMTDFVVSYDYQKTPLRLMLMFGTELGKYAVSAPQTTQHGQGVLLYPENDLGAGGGLVAVGNLATYNSSMRPLNRKSIQLEGYHEKGNWNFNIGTWHTMTVAVISGHCYIYLDDYGMIADYELTNYNGGYVSLAATGRGSSFDNLKITDLSQLTDSDIVSAENPRDITVLKGTDISALPLPTSVTATTKAGSNKNVSVTWSPVKYDAGQAGVYEFTAVIDKKTMVGATVRVRVVEELPAVEKGVKSWSFDTDDDLTDFKAYYLKNAETGYITEGVANWYVNASGKLTRDAFRAVNGDQYQEVAILTYTGEKYTNFELEVEYTQQWQRMMVLFGSEKAGQYIDLNDIYATSNPVAGFVEMEGVRNFIGNLTNANFDSNDKEKINNARESGVRLDEYYDKVLYGGNQGKKHTMKIRVVGDQAMMWVDNCTEPYVCTLTNYDGGYISLATTSKSGSFDNLKITRLGATPKEAVKTNQAVANGTMNVSIDASASTVLKTPDKVKPDTYKQEEVPVVTNEIPTMAYVVGGTTILLAALIGGIFILATVKKKKKENV